MEGRAGFDTMWSAIAPVGLDASSGGYQRFAWSREDHDLREWFAGECAARGLDLTTDRMGNQWAWWGDIDATVAGGGSGIAIGSHLDSVPDGGAFDGPLGVVSSLLAVDLLRSRGFQPSRPVAVVNFGDEEGARFGVACAGSKILTGALDAGTARALRDVDGVSMGEAMARAGHDPAKVGRDDETLRRVGAFVELHVEQGRSLVGSGSAVGVGSAVWAHGRWRLDLLGEANHAGTTRLVDRRDPMLKLAAAVVAARAAAEQHGAVATIGKVAVTPNAVNAIPSRVTAWLDARGSEESRVRAVVEAVSREVKGAAVQESWTAETTFDGDLVSRLVKLLDAPSLPTGAGHDAGILARAGVPAAMLFVRNPTGISHSPVEHAETSDCLAGVDALARTVMELAG